MLTLGPIGFTAPWLLLALPALPVLWWLLRVTPPAPKRQIFPPTRILRELQPAEATLIATRGCAPAWPRPAAIRAKSALAGRFAAWAPAV